MQTHQAILIVDDSNVIRSLLGITLTKSGYTVHSASSLNEAEEFLLNNHYDLMFLDYMLDRETTGFDLIKNMHRFNHTLPPIIMLSAEHSTAHHSEAKELGIKAWMRKPFTPDSILKLIQKIIPKSA